MSECRITTDTSGVRATFAFEVRPETVFTFNTDVMAAFI